MKLSHIHKIDESKRFINSEYNNDKVWILKSPSPHDVIKALDEVRDTLGGWILPFETLIWDRFRATHLHIAKELGFKTVKSTSFYIKPEEIIDNKVVDVNFEVSEYSGSKSINSLMAHPLIIGIMKILAQRKESMNQEIDNDDYSDILGSLSGADY